MGSKGWKKSTWGDEVVLEYGKSLRAYNDDRGLYQVFGSNGPIGWTSDYLFDGPGVILGRKGAYRGVEYSEKPFFVIDTAYSVKPLSPMNIRWLYYAVKYHKLGEIDDGSPIPSTTRAAVYVKKLEIPGRKEQDRISDILGTLDDKIELNRRTNETLEAIASALFKSWFVDFDPVHEKATGRKPVGLDPAIAKFFPDSFVDSPLGKIPKGWRVGTIKELTSKIQYGLTQSANNDRVGPHFLRITDIQGGRVRWADVPYCQASAEEIDRYRIQPGDVFVARTGASTGENVFIIKAPKAVFASYLVRFQFSEAGFARLVGEFMRTTNYFDFVASCLGGSAQPNASAQVLASASLIVPDPRIAEKFKMVLEPLDQQRCQNDEESQNLAVIRDALLPKLLNGEICCS